MATQVVQLRRRGWGDTMRPDSWWVQPLVVFTILSAFVVYTMWAAFQNAHYEFGNYLSPLYSPVLFGDSPHTWFGPKPASWPSFLPFSPALLILPLPGLFRLTCYYYRGAYYKAFWSDPPNCAVGEPRKGLSGRSVLSADPSEHPPVHSLHRADLHRHSVLRRVARDVVRQPGDRQGRVRHWLRHAAARHKRCSPGRVHVRVPLSAASRRRLSRSSFPSARSEKGLRLRELPQSRTHALGVVQSDHRGVLRRLCASPFDGCVDGLETFLDGRL